MFLPFPNKPHTYYCFLGADASSPSGHQYQKSSSKQKHNQNLRSNLGSHCWSVCLYYILNLDYLNNKPHYFQYLEVISGPMSVKDSDLEHFFTQIMSSWDIAASSGLSQGPRRHNQTHKHNQIKESTKV